MSKVIIAFPTTAEHFEIFEKTITGGFSCVNTRLAFDSAILLPKKEDGTRDNNWKVIYGINGKNERVISKILTLDENNQYGHAMTKPLPTGCIKNDSDLSWRTFNLLLESVSLEDKIGHLHIVDINSTMKMQLKNKLFIMKSIRQLLKNKKQLIHAKNQSINCLITTKRVKMGRVRIE